MRKHTDRAILVFYDDKLQEYRRIIFGDKEGLEDLLAVNMPFIMDAVTFMKPNKVRGVTVHEAKEYEKGEVHISLDWQIEEKKDKALPVHTVVRLKEVPKSYKHFLPDGVLGTITFVYTNNPGTYEVVFIGKSDREVTMSLRKDQFELVPNIVTPHVPLR